MLGSQLFAAARNWLEISSKCSTSKPHPTTPGSLSSHSQKQALGFLTALPSLLGEQRASPVLSVHLCHCHPKTGPKADPSPSSSSDFLALLSHHPTLFPVHSFILRATGIAIHLMRAGHTAGHHCPAFHIHRPCPTASPQALPLSHPLLEGNSHCSTVSHAEKNPSRRSPDHDQVWMYQAPLPIGKTQQKLRLPLLSPSSANS